MTLSRRIINQLFYHSNKMIFEIYCIVIVHILFSYLIYRIEYNNICIKLINKLIQMFPFLNNIYKEIHHLLNMYYAILKDFNLLSYMKYILPLGI